jgi:hypothetical protein
MGIQVFTDRTLRERDREKDDHIKWLEADNIRLEAQVARLTEQNKQLAEGQATLEAENEHLNKTWKFNYELLLERVGKAEQELQAMHQACSELLPFLRTIKPGVFRSDRNGKECYKELQARIVKYDSQMIGE